MSDRMLAWVGSVVVLFHTLINAWHAVAHRELGISISGWQASFVATVMGLASIMHERPDLGVTDADGAM